MAVINHREVLPRTFAHKFGESPTAERKWIVTVDAPTPHQEVIAAVGIGHGFEHPEYPYLRMLNASLSETDRQHVEISYSYEVPKDGETNPLARKDVWSFSTGGAAVPALVYYHGEGNNDRRCLVNAAGDFFEGAMTDEAELRASIAGNRAAFPLAVATAVTNCVNADVFLGAPPHHWKCQGISAQQQVEVVNDQEIRYWSVTVELAYRQSGWSLLLPNVGWNYIEGGKRKRAYVLDPDSGERVASSNPQPLNADGSLDLAYPGESNPPIILTRRVHRVVNFSQYFGTPPF